MNEHPINTTVTFMVSALLLKFVLNDLPHILGIVEPAVRDIAEEEARHHKELHRIWSGVKGNTT